MIFPEHQFENPFLVLFLHPKNFHKLRYQKQSVIERHGVLDNDANIVTVKYVWNNGTQWQNFWNNSTQ